MERCGNDQFDEDAVTRLSTRGGVWGTAVVRGCFVSSGHQHVDVQDFGGLRCSELLLQYAAMANSSDRGPDISGWSIPCMATFTYVTLEWFQGSM